MQWAIRGSVYVMTRPLIMGILNITPDSFSDGGCFLDPDLACAEAEKMISEGADILDLGAESTRPGAVPVSTEEELKRLLPVLKKIAARFEIIISVDTAKHEVARICLAEGAHIINDVSGLSQSGAAMGRLIAETEAGLVLMHSRGTPETMQGLTQYGDVTKEVIQEIRGRLLQARSFGIRDEQVVIDPGFGFAKDAAQNFRLLKNLDAFAEFNRPVLAGVSRKSFIGKAIGREAAERDFGTAAALAFAYERGAQIFRVHHVRAARDVLSVCEAVFEK
jgi:dihydropteroate synthase